MRFSLHPEQAFPYLAGPDTTRASRPGEQHGREYNFTDKDSFLSLVNEHGFIEHAQFGSNHYGTSVQAVKDIAEKGRICILDIEMEVHKFPDTSTCLSADSALGCQTSEKD